MADSQVPEPPTTTPDSSDLEWGNQTPSDSDNESPPIRRVRLPSEEFRPDHFETLMKKKKASQKYIDRKMSDFVASPGTSTESLRDQLTESTRVRANTEHVALKAVERYLRELKKYFNFDATAVEVHLKDFSYHAKVKPLTDSRKIETVYNKTIFYKASRWMHRTQQGQRKKKKIDMAVLDNVSLSFEPGKMYLVLGPPGSGKSALLKAIGARLPTSNGETVKGCVTYNGVSIKDTPGVYMENAIAYIDQHDYHAPRLTVQETFDFAWQCRSGGTHAPIETISSKAGQKIIKKLDSENARVKSNLDALDLRGVANTFVGNSAVRGVSGGQRRRVSVGEMMPLTTAPILCGDEISTGLDAASTYHILYLLMHYTRLHNMTRVISLLQPSPEAVSLFDEVVLLAEGRVLFAGPIVDVEKYFAELGYHPPLNMDIADFLQMISTRDGMQLFKPTDRQKEIRDYPYTVDQLADKFRESRYFEQIEERLSKEKEDFQHPWNSMESNGEGLQAIMMARLKEKYANSFSRSVWLLLKRNMTIWWRDKRFLIANTVKNVIMGVSVGGVFYQTESVSSTYGVLFQLSLFIMLGAMVSAPDQLDDRLIFYKHKDANFYGAFPYVLGKALALIPQTFADIMTFGSIIYWMVGLAPTVQNYFIYIAILFIFSLVMNQMLSIFAAVSETKTAVQGFTAVTLLFLVLFGGFIVLPDVIPVYYLWIYWWNPLAWAYRALLVNEYRSSEYDIPEEGTDRTAGQSILEFTGFTDSKGNAFTVDWIGFSFAYLVPYLFLCMTIQGLCLTFVRVGGAGGERSRVCCDDSDDSRNASETSSGENMSRGESGNEESANGGIANGQSTNGDSEVRGEGRESSQVYCEHGDIETRTGNAANGESEIMVPFKPVTLSFKNVSYDVTASKRKSKLRLLCDVNGIFESGRMCALMGTSGAGKTTLMDVIAMRKTTGNVMGDIRVNGFPQDKKSFRRYSGYVEQFDVQAPELTVRETVLFSARLRLDPEEPVVASDEAKVEVVDQVLRTLELLPLADCLVGDDNGGLTFEQRKRLSIAVELAASPSIIFLDEPTSGLDARAALIVVKALRKIADEGRTVIATIHQPSLAVFELFDDLLLLKKGGQVVFFGELGIECAHLVNYLEDLGATPIERGENPANYMLAALGAKLNYINFAEEYYVSVGFARLQEKLRLLVENRDPSQEMVYDDEFAASRKTRRDLVNTRMRTIYWRSPAYNRTRMIISVVIALLLGSVYLENWNPDSYTETELSSLLSTVFLSFIIVGVLAITSVLPVMQKIRDSFYRHRQSGMVDDVSLAIALGVAEKYFIIITSFLFCAIFLPVSGLRVDVGSALGFWGFFTFNLGIYSYFGQAFMCLTRTMPTAQILASVFIGLNNFFSGLIVRPQYIHGFFAIPWWITPGHYVYEGLVLSLFFNDTTPVAAREGSPFFHDLGCSPEMDDECVGTVWGFVNVFFGGKFKRDNLWIDIVVLGFYLLLARMTTFFALKYFNFTAS